MTVSAKVVACIHRKKRGVPFVIGSFYRLGSPASVQKAFSRLAKEGVIERVAKGIYVRPKHLSSIPSIKTTVSVEQVAKVWAKEYGYTLVEQGQEAAYRLGLQTQAPMKVIYWSNGPSRNFKLGNQTLEVRHVVEKKLYWVGKPEGAFLRGLIVTSPESVEESHFLNAFKRLSLKETEGLRVLQKIRNAGLLPAWEEKLRQIEKKLSQSHKISSSQL